MNKKLIFAPALFALLAACSDSNNSGSAAIVDQDFAAKLMVVGSYVSDNEFDSSAAEIVSYDANTDRLYVVNAEEATVDVLALDDDSVPSKFGSIDLSLAAADAGIEIGAANSVVAKNGLVAVAVEHDDKQQNGLVALYASDDLSLINTYPAGALPDMVTMTEDGNTILVANEGEPSDDYSNDPEGSVTVIDISAGTSDALASVTQVDFKAFNAGGSKTLGDNVRTPQPMGATVAQDLEPEYIALTEGGKAIVALQENNAFAIVDIASKTVEAVEGLGVKSWSPSSGNALDVTNKDGMYSPQSYEQLVGYYMPDSISAFTINGVDYVISANEGDGREYVYDASELDCNGAGHEWDDGDCISYTDEARAKDLNVADAHPLAAAVADSDGLGRIKVVADNMDIAADENIISFGARSFSIWNAETTELVYDSGDALAEVANDTLNFNASNDAHASDDRSDDKGIEPEAVEVAVIDGQTIAFIGLERQGGVAAYNVTDPAAPIFLDYINNRDFTANVCTVVDEDGECDNDTYNPSAGDLGPESIEYFYRNGDHFIAVGNEVSGTTTVFEVRVQ